jgi:pyridoxine 4-dehydrogenase
VTPDWERIGTVRLSETLRVRRVGFGGAWLTGPGTYGPPPDLGVARGIVRRAVACGVQLVDTADCYGPEISELLIAEALHPYPEDVVISTKGGRQALGDNRWRAVGEPGYLKRACDASLRRLRLDAIDLYQLNAVDPEVPLEESLGALVELRGDGKIRHIGVCNVDVGQLERARVVTQIASVQDRYDIHTRASDLVLDFCAREGIAFLPWFPPSSVEAAPARSALARISLRHAARPSQVALAWLLARSPMTVPLPGTTDPRRYEEDLAALQLSLEGGEIRDLTGDADA